MTAAERALEFVEPGDCIGLGTGHAASDFADALARRIHYGGLRVRAVPTSTATAERARALGITLASLDEVDELAVTIDGADEVDPQLDLIKGYGGALVRERVVAAASRRLVIVVGREKLVPVLGTRGTLPIEVVPFAVPVCQRELTRQGLEARLRMLGDRPFVTDNGNLLLHARVSPMADPARVLAQLRAIPGVVDAGLFLGEADVVIVQEEPGVRLLERNEPGRPTAAIDRAAIGPES